MSHNSDKLLQGLSLVRLLAVLCVTGAVSTNFGKNHLCFSSKPCVNNWPQEMRGIIGIEEVINAGCGAVFLFFSLLNDHKRSGIVPFSILKGLEFLLSLIAGILILSDLPDNTARSDAGFLIILFSFFAAKLSDIANIDNVYGGGASFTNKGDAKYENAGNSNISCCPYGFIFNDNRNQKDVKPVQNTKSENSTDEKELDEIGAGTGSDDEKARLNQPEYKRYGNG